MTSLLTSQGRKTRKGAPLLEALGMSREHRVKLTCHCKNIEIEVGNPGDLNCCNCSICSRYQALWAYYEPESVKISLGSVGEHTYTWNDHEIEFVRCAGCGCVTHYRTVAGDPDPIVGVNFRMAPEEILTEIPVRYSNGRAL